MNSVSFIILSYNQSDNIIKIINSIIYSKIDYELIIIDNNSIDNTEEKIKEFCNNKNIAYKFINNPIQKNQSLSRNIGVKNATKDYVYFVDGDDYLNSYFLHKMKLNTDIVFVPRIAKDLDDIKYSININNIENKNLYSSAVQAFYRRDLLIKYNIWHEEEKYYYYSEDLLFTALLFDAISFYMLEYSYIDNDYLYFGIKRETSTPINNIEYMYNYYMDYYSYLLSKMNTELGLIFVSNKITNLIKELKEVKVCQN